MRLPTLNPLVERELLGRMRAGRTIWLLVAYVAALGGLMALVVALSTAGSVLGPNTFEVAAMAFDIVVGLELVLVGMVSAAAAAGAISGERERQTWELLLVTGLSPWRIVSGKLVSAVMLVLWLVVAGMPVFAPVLYLGAVPAGTLLRLLGLFVVSALAWAGIGLAWSALLRRTIGAVVAAYVTGVLWVILAPILRAVLQATVFTRAATGPRVEGPFLVELLNPVYALLWTLNGELVGALGIPAVAAGGPTANLTLAARLAGALGPGGPYWVYVGGALLTAGLMALATTRLIQRRRA